MIAEVDPVPLPTPDQNARFWGRARVAREYVLQHALDPAEAVLFQDYGQILRGARILDIGCGGGRTARHLSEISARYVGIDYSAAMIGSCRALLPRVAFELCDMRDLGAFQAGSFDVAVCAFNSLDYVGHDDRLRVLHEVCRVLGPGGLFIFSSHNLNYSQANQPPRLCWSVHPKRMASHLFDFLRETVNHGKNRRREFRSAEYTILNDCAYHYSLLTYYIARPQEYLQLQMHGFEVVEARDVRGELLHDEADAHSPWLYYVARKLQSGQQGMDSVRTVECGN